MVRRDSDDEPADCSAPTDGMSDGVRDDGVFTGDVEAGVVQDRAKATT